jgi:lipoprotein-anchoring transpeptidase ErfK/SrfK
MKSNEEDFHKILLNAQQSLRLGDRLAARHWAEIAVELDPNSEEAWLTMAAVASPRASINYLEQALKINPQSQQAQKGMQWAKARLLGEQPKSPVGRVVPESKIHPSNQPEDLELHPQEIEQPVPSSKVRSPKSWAKYRWPILALCLTAICVSAVWAFWPVSAAPVLAFLHAPHSTPVFAGILGDVGKPTDTLNPTDTQTPTLTFTPTLVSTDPPIPTDTIPPTDTIAPTDTPSPTNTEPPLTTKPPAPVVNVTGGGVRWIDVSLSKQMLYAYEGNTIVRSFLVSTGVAEFPTVTGKFHIYIKYLYTDMHGADYFLPNVPYTMYFYKSYGIHGTYWHHNFGHPMSHGCVNMYTPDAEWLYYWASVGTLVNIHY